MLFCVLKFFFFFSSLCSQEFCKGQFLFFCMLSCESSTDSTLPHIDVMIKVMEAICDFNHSRINFITN